MDVTIGLAFLAGLASFLSPCVFSLVPAYISYLSGRAVAGAEAPKVAAQNVALSVAGVDEGYGSIEMDEQVVKPWQPTRLDTFTHGVAFVIGFSVVFIVLGVAVSALGGLLYDLRDVLAKVGGVVVIVFGLHMTGILRIPLLEYDLRPQSREEQNRSYFSSALMGVFFSAGWSPCVGPVLGAILTMAFQGGSVIDGVKLLSAYSAGLAIPFLLAALGIGWVTAILRRHRKLMHYVEIVMGVILIIVGLMLLFGVFNLLARYGLFVDFGL